MGLRAIRYPLTSQFSVRERRLGRQTKDEDYKLVCYFLSYKRTEERNDWSGDNDSYGLTEGQKAEHFRSCGAFTPTHVQTTSIDAGSLRSRSTNPMAELAAAVAGTRRLNVVTSGAWAGLPSPVKRTVSRLRRGLCESRCTSSTVVAFRTTGTVETSKRSQKGPSKRLLEHITKDFVLSDQFK